MIRHIFALAIFVICFSSLVAGQDFQTKTDSLTTAVLINPNDLLHVVTGWDIATTDGFTYRTNSGLYGFYGPQPSIYLDGLPVDFSFFNWQNLNMLPASIQHIGSVSYSSAPQVYNNNLARSGFFDLHSVQPDTGFSASGSFAVGNQIEDPGPWSYDSTKVTPNIDRRGPQYFAGLSYLNANWQIQGQLWLRQHQPTNLNNHHRIGSYSYVDGKWYAVKNTVTNGLANVAYTSNNWAVQSRVLYSDNEEYLFFQPFGREIPANTGYLQFSLQGDRRAGAWNLEGRYSGNLKEIAYRINNKGYDFDWQQFTHQLGLSAQYQKPHFQISMGGMLEYVLTESQQLNNNQAVATLYGKGQLHLSPLHSLYTNLDVDIATTQTAPSLTLGSQHQLNNFWTLNTDLNYVELLYYRQENSTYWIRRGYDFFRQLGIDQRLPLSSKKNRSASLQLTNSFTLTPQVHLTIGGEFVRHYALNIPWQQVSFGTIENQNQGVYTNPEAFYFTSEKGSRYKLTLGLSQHINPVISHSLDMMAKYSSSGSVRYRSYWQQIPQEQLTYRLKYTPFDDLSLAFSAVYRSSTLWKEYQSLEGKQYRSLQPQYPFRYGTFHTRTPSFFNVGLTAKKWFWNRRLATTFSLRNLLNTEVRYHTLGLDKALQFVVKASLTL